MPGPFSSFNTILKTGQQAENQQIGQLPLVFSEQRALLKKPPLFEVK